MLQDFQQEYDALDLQSNELILLGNTIRICYDRLEMLEIEPDARKKLDFYEKHVEALSLQRSDTADNSQLAEKLDEQILLFRESIGRYTRKLAASDPEFSVLANLRNARQLIDQGFEPAKAELLLQSFNDIDEELEKELAPRTLQEVNFCRSKLLYEQSWWTAERLGKMPPSEISIEIEPEFVLTPELAYLSLELRALSEEFQDSEIENIIEKIRIDRSLDENLLVNVLANAVLGNWKQARSLLAQKLAVASGEEQLRIRKKIAISILRLFYAKRSQTSPEWLTAAPQGLLLAEELYPSARELNILLWELAKRHADLAAEKRISKDLVESILVSDSKHRYLILAISNGLRGSHEPANNYYSFAQKSDPNASNRLANLVFWKASVLPDDSQIPLTGLEALLNSAENPSELADIARARLLIKRGAVTEARIILKGIKSEELAPLANSMLESAPTQ